MFWSDFLVMLFCLFCGSRADRIMIFTIMQLPLVNQTTPSVRQTVQFFFRNLPHPQTHKHSTQTEFQPHGRRPGLPGYRRYTRPLTNDGAASGCGWFPPYRCRFRQSRGCRGSDGRGRFHEELREYTHPDSC